MICCTAERFQCAVGSTEIFSVYRPPDDIAEISEYVHVKYTTGEIQHELGIHENNGTERCQKHSTTLMATC